MAQATRLVHELKSQLKIRGITYRELAHELQLSESAVKQMFSSGNMTLARLDRICEILSMDLADLLQACLLYTSPSPRDRTRSRMPSSA